MKKILTSALIFLGLFFFASFTKAEVDFQNNKVDIDFFYSKTCSHCSAANEFLNKVSLKDSNIRINKFDVSEKESIDLLINYYEKYKVDEQYKGSVPVIFIGNRYFVGFEKNNSESKIENAINAFVDNEEDIDNEDDLVGNFSTVDKLRKEIKLPFIGSVDLQKAHPIIISIVFGALDGFNACAMATLAFLLAVLIGIGDRKKLILLGGIFILVSGIVYYAFIAAWLNLFLIIPHLNIITYIVGIVMIVFGIYVLKEYFNGIICKLCEIKPDQENWFSKNQKKLMLKTQEIISSNKSMTLIIGGVIVLAAGINSIELICSFGLPVAFTKILTSYNLSSLSYYFYILIYDIFYMLDDFMIFLIAVFTFNLVQESERYIKAAKFISGVLLIVLGIIIIFFPEFLGSI